MVIQHKYRNDCDIYWLKGALDEHGFRQLDFIVRTLGGQKGRVLQFDFRQVRRDPVAGPRWLKALHESARKNCNIRFTGVEAREKQSCTQIGLPASVFV